MSSQPVEPSQPPGSPASVLAAARSHHDAIRRAEAALLLDAVAWAGKHEPASDDPGATWWAAGVHVPIAGEGVPLIAEEAVAEFAAAVGMSTDAGRRFVGEALEIAYRLPVLYRQVKAGTTPVWRARRIAQATIALPPLGAAFVDRAVAAVHAKVSVAQLDRIVAEAVHQFTTTDTPRGRGRGRRHVTVFDTDPSLDGTVHVAAESLDARRALALGELARLQLALTYPDTDSTGAAGPDSLGRCGLTRSPVTAESIRAWCANAQVTVTPVIDLDAHIRSDQYEIRGRLKAQIDHRDGMCVFPWCTRPARVCDHDHAIAHDDGGPSCSCNITLLCRHHHRLKTRYRWRLKLLEPGLAHWTSPHGYQFLRDHAGTTDITPPGHTPHPGCPPDDGADPRAGPPAGPHPDAAIWR